MNFRLFSIEPEYFTKKLNFKCSFFKSYTSGNVFFAVVMCPGFSLLPFWPSRSNSSARGCHSLPIRFITFMLYYDMR